MKRSIFSDLLVLGLVLALGGGGCKSPKKPTTPIPGQNPTVGNAKGAPPIGPGPALPGDTGPGTTSTQIPPNSDGTIKQGDLAEFEGRAMDREAFKAYTVYFEFDKSSIKHGELTKIESVADYLKKNPKDYVLIEGHCDERGTEEYNRALGERRALSARERLAGLGVGAERIRTLSYGEDKPADPGHDEAAWSKNRRGEFIRLLPKE
jgi:peptidoglycan-associated lipoprotein